MPKSTIPEIEPFSQSQLDEAIKKHGFFSIGKPGGARALLRFKDLSNLNFRGADLSGADFTGSKLINANLAKGNFSGTVFYSCEMQGVNLSNSKLVRADLRGANLTGANLDGADMTKADTRAGIIDTKKIYDAPTGADVKPTVIKADDVTSPYYVPPEKRGAQTESHLTLGPEQIEKREAHVDLSREKNNSDPALSSNLDLSVQQSPEKRDSSLILTGEQIEARNAAVDLTQSTKETGYQSNIDLSKKENNEQRQAEIDLSQSEIPSSYESNLSLSPDDKEARTSALDLSQKSQDDQRESDLVLEQKDETRDAALDLSLNSDKFKTMLVQHAKWLQMTGKGGEQMNLSNEDLRSLKDLAQYPMIMIKALETNFSGLYLKKADMQSSEFNNSNFSNCILSEADMRGSIFTGANFSGADLTNALFSPLKLKLGSGREHLKKTDLSGANFKGAKLNKTNFKDALLVNADFRGCDTSSANFEGADLTGAIPGLNPLPPQKK